MKEQAIALPIMTLVSPRRAWWKRTILWSTRAILWWLTLPARISNVIWGPPGPHDWMI